MDREQKLVDACYAMVLAATADRVFCKKTNEEKAAWVSATLRELGFPTLPCGSKWGVLIPAKIKSTL